MSNRIEPFFEGMTPTDDQRRVAESLEAFFSSDANVYVLNGYAGTGKTTLLRSVCRYLESQSRSFRLLAPTGRAARILQHKTGHICHTIHRSIYNLEELEERQEGSSYRARFRLQANADSSDCIYFVDEASLISDVFSDNEFFIFGSGHLLADLITFSEVAHSNRKLVFIGDTAQLTPVNMASSPALSPEYLTKLISKIQTGQLQEVVRQNAESTVLKAATTLRTSIASNVFHTFSLPSDAKDIFHLKNEDILNTYFRQLPQPNPEYGVIITHSNRQALDYNLRIRERMGIPVGEGVRKNDWLIITRNNYQGTVELFNGMFVKVLEVGRISYQVNRSFKIANGQSVTRFLAFRDILVEIYTATGDKHLLRTTLLDRFLTEESGSLHPYDQRALYIDFKERMRARDIKPKTAAFKEQLRSDPYFNALQAKYGYALTCHKAQGGEWPKVFVDMKVYSGKASSLFFRWAYTAITRTSSLLFVVDAPGFNPLSSFVTKETERLTKIPDQQFYVPPLPEGISDFVAYRELRIRQLCEAAGIQLNIKAHPYQLACSFERGQQKVEARLWYGKAGFKRSDFLNIQNADFQEEVDALLMDSLHEQFVPMVPEQPFQVELQEYMLQLLDETAIPLTNILNRAYSVIYYIQADDYASLEFHFNDRNIFTSLTPRAIQGKEDKRLQLLLEKINGNKF